MTKLTPPRRRGISDASVHDVAATLRRLRDEIRDAAGDDRTGGGGPSVANMRAYLALRRHDNRVLQAALARLGVSLLGRSEAHVLVTIEQVLEIVERLAADAPTAVASSATSIAFDESSDLLRQRTRALFGERRENRETRIMVTQFWALVSMCDTGSAIR